MHVQALATIAGAGLTAALLSASAPAHHGHPGHGGHPSHGQKQRVTAVVQDYFTDRDRGWLPPTEQPAPAVAASRVAAQPAAVSQEVDDVARAAAEERGLVVEDVSTAFPRRTQVKIRGHRATVTTTPTTFLEWADQKLGESSLADTYRVELTRTRGKVSTPGGDWRIVKVSLVDPPTTEESARGSAGRPKPRSNVDRKAAARRASPADAKDVGTLDTHTYDREAAAQYARYWSGSDRITFLGTTFVVPRYNSDWDHVWEEHPSDVNDCTNFTSQMLYAGGWTTNGGIDPGDLDNWTDSLWGPSNASETWTIAYQQWRYGKHSDRAEHWKSGRPSETDRIWDLEPGDLLYADWDPDEKPDGRIDHAMAISGTYTELGFTEPTYSQHTPHRHNIPLSVGIKIAMSEPGSGGGPDNGQGRDVIYYPVHVKDEFTD
ncbi:amidase domain-containing protein [Mumia qirimensis]|uniref:amidase domain-containing protein n=1 Tax=Mumia qirimensis TaxID=3234852 RepID=UPI00351D3899